MLSLLLIHNAETLCESCTCISFFRKLPLRASHMSGGRLFQRLSREVLPHRRFELGVGGERLTLELHLLANVRDSHLCRQSQIKVVSAALFLRYRIYNVSMPVFEA